MGERQAPPLTSAILHADESASTQSLGDFRWPPPGWPMFSCVTRNAGTAMKADRSGHEDGFLKYELSVSQDGVYNLEIFSGRIGPSGASLTSALGMRFAAREDWFDDNPQNAVLDLHVRGQRLIPERGCVLRMILAMTFIISRIDRGVAPSLKRVLKLYRLA